MFGPEAEAFMASVSGGHRETTSYAHLLQRVVVTVQKGLQRHAVLGWAALIDY